MKKYTLVLFLLAIMPLAAFRAAPAAKPASSASIRVPQKYLGGHVRVDLRHPTPAPHWTKGSGKLSGPDIALWQEGCYQNTAYFIWFDVNGHWTDSVRINNGNVQVTVFYMWCPRWPSDPYGLNFAGGTIQAEGRSAVITLGTEQTWPWNVLGASLEYDGYQFGDGNTAWQLTLNPWSSSTDWSLPESGASAYLATFKVNYFIPDSIYTTAGTISVQTPYPA